MGCPPVEPVDAKVIVGAMHRLLNNAELRKDLVRRGRTRATAFSREKTGAQYLELYQPVGHRPKFWSEKRRDLRLQAYSGLASIISDWSPSMALHTMRPPAVCGVRSS